MADRPRLCPLRSSLPLNQGVDLVAEVVVVEEEVVLHRLWIVKKWKVLHQMENVHPVVVVVAAAAAVSPYRRHQMWLTNWIFQALIRQSLNKTRTYVLSRKESWILYSLYPNWWTSPTYLAFSFALKGWKVICVGSGFRCTKVLYSCEFSVCNWLWHLVREWCLKPRKAMYIMKMVNLRQILNFMN